MTEVVVKVAVRAGEEARLFGLYLSRFMRSWANEAERSASSESDAPWFMMRSDPGPGVDLKTLVFQESWLAQAFSYGWDEALEALG